MKRIRFLILAGIGILVSLTGVMALPSAQDIPEEILRTEIFTQARIAHRW